MKTKPFLSLIIASSLSFLPWEVCSASTLNNPVVADNVNNPLMFTMKGDTLVYDMNGITFRNDASVAAILSKFPGVVGSSTVNGKSIAAVLIDGKEFKGQINNAELIGKLPAYMVKTIQAYEREPEAVRGRRSSNATMKELVINLQLADEYRNQFTGEIEAGAGLTFSDNNSFEKKTLYTGNAFGMKSTTKSRFMASVSGDNIDSYSPFTSDGNSNDAALAVCLNGLYQINKESRYQGSLKVNYDEYSNQVNSLTTRDYNVPANNQLSNKNNYDKSLTTTHEFKYRSDNDVLGLFQNPDFYVKASASINKYDVNLTDLNESISSSYSADNIYHYHYDDIVYSNSCKRHKTNSVALSGYAVASPINNDKIDFKLSFELSHGYSENRLNTSNGRLYSITTCTNLRPLANESFTGNSYYAPSDSKYDHFRVGLNMSMALDDNEKHHLNFGDSFFTYSDDSNYKNYALSEFTTLGEYNMYSVLMEPNLTDNTLTRKGLNNYSYNTNTFSLNYSYNSKNSVTNNENYLKVGVDMPLSNYRYDYLSHTSYNLDTVPLHYVKDKFFVNPYVTYQFKNVSKGLEVYVNGRVYDSNSTSSEGITLVNVYNLNGMTKFMIGRSMFNASINYNKYGKESRMTDWSSTVNIGVDIPLSSDDKWRIKDRFSGVYYEYVSDLNSYITTGYFDLVFRPNKKMEFSAISYSKLEKSKLYSIEKDIYDFYYGLSTVLDLPFDFQLTAEALNYGRRNYENKSDNTNTFVLNAGLSKMFMNGKLLLTFDGHDLLGKMKPCSETVSAESIITTDKNCFPSYGMMRVTYRF